jgi:hypothetical protein
VLGRGQPAALLAVLRCENLEAAAQLEARLEHVQVVVVVFDVEHFGHVADSVLLTAALITPSFDHLVGAGEHSRRDIEAERLGRLEVDDELERGGQQDGQVRMKARGHRSWDQEADRARAPISGTRRSP